MHHLALSWLFIVALTGTALAQTSTPASIAWTAYLAAEADDQSRIPELEAKIPLLLEGNTIEHRFALGSVADALVRLSARPRLDLLPLLFKRHPVESLLLLQRCGPERNALALRLINTSRGFAWFALADLLFQAKAPGFAESVIRDLPVNLFISVSERGDTTYPISENAPAMYCDVGIVGAGFCKNSSVVGGNTAVIVRTPGYGWWQARTRHYYTNPLVVNLPNRDRPLYSGDYAPIECANRGADYWNGSECVFAPGSPIIIATGKDAAYTLTYAEQGVLFDIDADGVPEQLAWTQAGAEVAFLAVDLDGDGRISDGKELFGNHTYAGVNNGFTALARMNMATNGGVPRGSVSSDDPLFAKLLLWFDYNHNGVSEPSELRPASESLTDIGLGYSEHKRRDGSGNEFRFKGWATVRTAPGRNRAEEPAEQQERKRLIYDVFFKLAGSN